jgi:hypothetical protein
MVLYDNASGSVLNSIDFVPFIRAVKNEEVSVMLSPYRFQSM